MEWELRFSRDGWPIDGMIARGQTLPDWFLDEPEVVPGDEIYMRAFWDLSTCRALGFGVVGPIPWSDIVAYGQHLGLVPDVLRAFTQIIRQVDSEGYLKWQAAEAEKNRRKKK